MAFYQQPVRFGINVSQSTLSLGANDPELGARCIVDKMEYLFVYNNSTGSATAGTPVSLSAVTGYSICATHVTALDLCIGVRQHSTLATLEYGWVATRGIGTINMGANESCVTGQILCLGVGGLAVKTNSTNYQTPAYFKALESIASGASGKAYFQCM